MENKKQKDKVEELKEEIYSRSFKQQRPKRSILKKLTSDSFENSWGNDMSDDFYKDEDLYKYQRKGPSIFTILFILALVFFFISASAAFFLFQFGKKEIPNDINMLVVGPNSIESGKVLEFQVKLENTTELSYNDISFVLDFPESSLDLESQNFIENKEHRVEEALLEGGQISKKFRVVLSGAVEDEKEIKITSFYKADGYSAILSKKKVYKVKISSAPVDIKVSYPKEVISSKEFEVKIDISSNTETSLIDLLLVSRFPSGFKLTSTEPEKSDIEIAKTSFKIETLNPGETKTLIIRGYLAGQNKEDKYFNFVLGDTVPFTSDIRTVFTKIEEEISIKKPEIALAVTSNKIELGGDVLADAGSGVSINMSLSNNLKTTVSDLKIEAELPNELIVTEETEAEGGYYDSNKGIIVWDKNTNTILKSLSGGERFQSGFDLKIKPLNDIAGYFNDPEIKIKFKITGTSFNEQNAEGQVLEEIVKIIKIPTKVNIASTVLHADGPFHNMGSINPEVGKETTYTIKWEIFNSTSDVKDVKVKAKLPPYITYLEKVSPETSYLSYDEESREITWQYNLVESQIGYRTDPKAVYFQVGFTPSAQHTDSSPVIILEKTIDAFDTFLERPVFNKAKSDDIKIRSDSSYEYGVGVVVSQKEITEN